MLKQPGIHSIQISLLAERGVVEYEEDFKDGKGMGWDDARIAEEIEDIGFEAEVVEKSEVDTVELRVYGWVITRFALFPQAMLTSDSRTRISSTR